MANEKRLIDANALISNLRTFKGLGAMVAETLVRFTEKQPTVDAVEVVHGEWRYYSTTMQECSNCQRHTARHKFKYCPHCGAVMEDKYNDG